MKYLSVFKLEDLLRRLPDPDTYHGNTFEYPMLPNIEFSVKMTPQADIFCMPEKITFYKIKKYLPNTYEWAIKI